MCPQTARPRQNYRFINIVSMSEFDVIFQLLNFVVGVALDRLQCRPLGGIAGESAHVPLARPAGARSLPAQ